MREAERTPVGAGIGTDVTGAAAAGAADETAFHGVSSPARTAAFDAAEAEPASRVSPEITGGTVGAFVAGAAASVPFAGSAAGAGCSCCVKSSAVGAALAAEEPAGADGDAAPEMSAGDPSWKDAGGAADGICHCGLGNSLVVATREAAVVVALGTGAFPADASTPGMDETGAEEAAESVSGDWEDTVGVEMFTDAVESGSGA